MVTLSTFDFSEISCGQKSSTKIGMMKSYLFCPKGSTTLPKIFRLHPTAFECPAISNQAKLAVAQQELVLVPLTFGSFFHFFSFLH